jgi:holo-ACP synthase CitX
MLLDKLKSEILKTRDHRQDLLDRHLAAGYPATLVLSLNIPGAIKNPPGSEMLFAWALDQLGEEYSGLAILETSHDLLGSYAVMGIQQAAIETKHRCIELETLQPAARLVDLDVYDSQGRQVDRASLYLSPRPCLVCNRSAVECIRLGRHTASDLTEKINELLAPYRD